MDTHGTTTVVDTAHGYAVPETGERFEKSELEFFVDDDRAAGKNIGKLLAITFLISFVLMFGVCAWMVKNASHGPDPQAGIGTDGGPEHH